MVAVRIVNFMAHVPERKEDMSSYSEGQTHQLMEAFERIGYAPAHVSALGQNRDGVLDKMLLVLMGSSIIVSNPVFRLRADYAYTGDWICLEPVGLAEGEFEVLLYKFLEADDNSISGTEMIRCAKQRGIASSIRHLEAMLREPRKIPVEWDGLILVSTEVWQDTSGALRVWYSSCCNGLWRKISTLLEKPFCSRCRLVVPRRHDKA